MTDQPAPESSTTSAQADETAARPPANRKVIAFISALVGAVVLIGLVTAVVISAIGGGAPGAVLIGDYQNPPRTEVWTIGHRLVTDASDGDYLYVNSVTVAQDRALITWTKEETRDGKLLEFIDTRSGASLWTLPWEHESFELVGASSAGPLIISSYVNDKTVYFSIDRSSGAIISDTAAHGGMWMPSGIASVRLPNRAFNDLIDVSSLFNGDLILQSEEGVGRYSPHDLENPKWFIERDDEASGPIGIGLRTFHYQGRAFWLDSGQSAPWNGASNVSYVVIDGYMLGSDPDSRSLTGVDPATGAQTWRLDLDDAGAATAVVDGTLILASPSTSSLAAIDLGTGKEVWSRSVDLTGGGNFAAMLPDINAALLPIGGDRSYVTAIDLATGDDLYSMPVSENGEWWKEFVGSSASYIYLYNSKTGELEAADIRTGLTVWTLGEIGQNPSYRVEVMGGQFVAVLRSAEVSGYQEQPALIGLRP